VNKKRPVNLDLSTLKFPPMAIASILHRISGVALFLLMPVMLYILGQSLQSQETFTTLQQTLNTPLWKIVLWLFGAAIIYHTLAGIRHLLMDFGLGEELHSGRQSANAVIILSVILTIILGYWIW